MLNLRKILMTAGTCAMLLCMNGCYVLRDESDEELRTQNIPRRVHTESVTETEEPETAQVPETSEIPETTAETQAVTEFVPEELMYPSQALLDMYAYYDAIEDHDMPESFAGVDWAAVPEFTDDAQLEWYLREQYRKCSAKIPVILVRGCSTPDEHFFDKETGMMYISLNTMTMEKDGIKARFVVYEPWYSTGFLAVHAMETGDTSLMDEQDLQAYAVAKRFVEEELDTSASLLAQEKQIHDYICGLTEYYDAESANMRESFRMAAGVLLDGRANCMGYTDAFYLLATMAGFEVRTDSGGNHAWNIITLDGKQYLMDVTWNDDVLYMPDGTTVNQYTYFNCGQDVAAADYEWDEGSLTSQIVPFSDEHYFYLTQEEGFGIAAEGVDTFSRLAAEGLMTGNPVYIMGLGIPEDARNIINHRILSILKGSGTLQSNYYEAGEYVYGYFAYDMDE